MPILIFSPGANFGHHPLVDDDDVDEDLDEDLDEDIVDDSS